MNNAVAKYFREYKDNYNSKWMRKYRKKNSAYRFNSNKEYQKKWREKNIELNRERARKGMLVNKMFWDFFKLAKLRKL